MGIQGLLPLLKDIQVQCNIINFKGQTVGIDTYCWLHKGSYACAKDLMLGRPTNVFVHYVMKRVHMLINNGITPILVFDGGYLPAKAGKEKDRRKKREEYRKKGMAALRSGNTHEASEHFQKCCDVTPEMAAAVIQACFSLGVQCIVAPYEADAQLAYLMKNGITQLTISEDSDLLLYGCHKVLYKMSAEGNGILIDLSNLSKVRTVQLSSFTFQKFRHMCMLSGCDYLSSIKGLGLIKAHKLINRHADVYKCIRVMKCDPSYYVPDDYAENFRKADFVFKYQLVFDPRSKKTTRLNELEENDSCTAEDLIYAGPCIADEKALQIALGNIDPIHGNKIAAHKNFAHGKVKNISAAPTFTSTKDKFERKLRHHSSHVEASNLRSEADDASRVAATQSLKRLRVNDETSDNCSKFHELYEELSEDGKQEKESDFSTHSHSSVFKRKKYKFLNPFRKNPLGNQDNDGDASRYFLKIAPHSHVVAEKHGVRNSNSEKEMEKNKEFIHYKDMMNANMSDNEAKCLVAFNLGKTCFQEKDFTSKNNFKFGYNAHTKTNDNVLTTSQLVSNKNSNETLRFIDDGIDDGAKDCTFGNDLCITETVSDVSKKRKIKVGLSRSSISEKHSVSYIDNHFNNFKAKEDNIKQQVTPSEVESISKQDEMLPMQENIRQRQSCGISRLRNPSRKQTAMRNNVNLKQTRISFDKFAFKTKPPVNKATGKQSHRKRKLAIK